MTNAVVMATQFDWSLFGERLLPSDGPFWRALATTVYVALTAQAVGVVLGVASALAGMSRRRALRWLSGLYVLLIRGTPLIVQIFFMYFGANILLGVELFPTSASVLGVTISGAVLAGIAALAINEGAYMSEIVRAGIGAVGRGQMDAAKAVGMTYATAMRRVILPQAARVIVPPLGNEFNNMLKNTSLLAFIGVYELFQDAEVGYSRTFQPLEYFVAVAFWYLVLTSIWSLAQVQLERRLGASDREEDETWAAKLFGARQATVSGR